jgi:hypothetical protein
LTEPGIAPDPDDEKEPYEQKCLKGARWALKRLEFETAKGFVDDLRDHLGFPGTRPGDPRKLACVLEGIRICMFIDCEKGNLRDVARHVDEVKHFLLEPGEPVENPLVAVAMNWVQGWQAELRGRLPQALYYRSSSCRHLGLLMRVRELTEKDPDGRYRKWRYGEATEAALLVDIYTDWIRTIRLMRPPVGTMKFKREELAKSFLGNPILKLLEHDKIDIWSYRRACARLGFEAADHDDDEHRQDAIDFLAQAAGAFSSTKPDLEHVELAKLERPLITTELRFAHQGCKHDPAEIEELKREADEILARHGFGRRLDFLNSQWDFFVRVHGSH